MIPDNLTPAQAEAIDDLLHNLDLIGARPLQCEIDWVLRGGPHVGIDTLGRSVGSTTHAHL